jgi:AbrB family transcriptional regulator (stage V sporulation protein T)
VTYQAKVISGGKIVLPADLRRELGIEPGDTLVVERDGSSIVIKTYAQVVKESQAAFRAMLKPGHAGSLADALIADREADAANEQADHAERQARTAS